MPAPVASAATGRGRSRLCERVVALTNDPKASLPFRTRYANQLG